MPLTHYKMLTLLGSKHSFSTHSVIAARLSVGGVDSNAWTIRPNPSVFTVPHSAALCSPFSICGQVYGGKGRICVTPTELRCKQALRPYTSEFLLWSAMATLLLSTAHIAMLLKLIFFWSTQGLSPLYGLRFTLASKDLKFPDTLLYLFIIAPSLCWCWLPMYQACSCPFLRLVCGFVASS